MSIFVICFIILLFFKITFGLKIMDANKKRLVLTIEILTVILSAALSAFGLYYFVYPADFAPSGFDGVAAMLQRITKVNAGVYTAILNLPFLIWAFLKLDKKYVLYTVLFTILASVGIYLLEALNCPQYQTETDRILPAIFAGLILGVRTGLMMRIGSSTGGVDIVACMVQSKKPHVNIEKAISLICYVIIAISFFVYDNDITCILLSIIQTFVMEKAMEFILKDNRNAIEVKIVTKNPDILKEKILFELKHGATVIDCTGMYTGEERRMVITIINVRQLGELTRIIKELPDTFIYYSDVTGIKGNFRWKSTDIPH